MSTVACCALISRWTRWRENPSKYDLRSDSRAVAQRQQQLNKWDAFEM